MQLLLHSPSFHGKGWRSCAHTVSLGLPPMVSESPKDNSSLFVVLGHTYLEESHPNGWSHNHPGQSLTAHGKIPEHAGSHVQ